MTNWPRVTGLRPTELSGLKTTEGLADIVAAAGELIAALR